MSQPTLTLRVAAGALINADGEVLINERPAGKPMAGYWEFPGGKLESGETAEAALIRELHEELGIDVEALSPLIQLQHRYPDKIVKLDVFTVSQWSGTAQGLEGQMLAWCLPERLPAYKLLPADGPIVQALQLPERYFITPDCSDIAELEMQLQKAAAAKCGIVQIRQKRWPEAQLHAALSELAPAAAELGLVLQVNGLSHLTAAQLNSIHQRPNINGWVSASCHNAHELEKAAELGLDFALLGAVQTTASHPDQQALGWEQFGQLSSQAKLPVYALGGLCSDDITQAKTAGAQGVAAISAWQ